MLERNNSNAKYRCPTCNHQFSGGNQKIRVHITGIREGGSSVKACTNPNPDALAYCSTALRRPYKRRGDEEEAPVTNKKKSKKLNDDQVETNCLEAWGLLHNSSKFATVSYASPSDGVDGASRNPSEQIFQEVVLRLFDEYGVEKPEDLALLDAEHVLKLAEVLKVVPRKVFLELLGVEPPRQITA